MSTTACYGVHMPTTNHPKEPHMNLPIDWNWLLEAHANNPFSDAELAAMGTNREELNWHLDKAQAE